MNEIEKVLSLFKTAEDWNSFVELSNMKDMMVRELKRRLLTEMQKIAESNLSGAGWEYPVFVNEAPGFSPSGVDEVIDLLLLGIHPEQDRHRPARVGRYVVQAIHCLDRFADPG